MRLREDFADNAENGGDVAVAASALDGLAEPGGPPAVPLVPRTDRVRVGWAMPNYGPIFSQVYASHLSAIAYASRYFTTERLGDIPLVGATDRMYLHSAANEVVRQALAEPSITHIFWVESDMILPVDILPRLLELGKPIASGVYFLRGGSGQPCLYAPTPIETKENPYLHTPITVYDERAPFPLCRRQGKPAPGGCPGMGCVLISTEVFRQIDEPWFDLKANDVGKKNGYGQDLYFYTKVKKAGFEVWVDPGVLCDQIDTQVVGYADYRRRLATDKGIGAGGFIALDGSNDSAA